jgi:hypothetical protein
MSPAPYLAEVFDDPETGALPAGVVDVDENRDAVWAETRDYGLETLARRPQSGLFCGLIYHRTQTTYCSFVLKWSG